MRQAKAGRFRITHPEHDKDFQERGNQGGHADSREFPQAEFEPQRKHEEDDAQLGERVDGRFVIGMSA